MKHDILLVLWVLLAVFWAVGMRWAWSAFRGAALVARVILTVAWPVGYCIARWMIVQCLLAAVLAGALLAHASPALAVEDGVDVTLTALPCASPEVRALIERAGDDPRDYRLAQATQGDRAYGACWTPLWKSREILVLYEDGDHSLAPMDAVGKPNT